MPVWITAFIVVAAILLTNRTKLGRHIYAIGGNETAARLAGIKIKRVKVIVYSIAGALSAVGGIIVTSRLDSAQPNAGMGFELDSIAAVVMGGTSFAGGRGGVMGTIVGVLIIIMLYNLVLLLHLPVQVQYIVKGSIIIMAASFYAVFRKSS
jgi:ribose transport system permease protein